MDAKTLADLTDLLDATSDEQIAVCRAQFNAAKQRAGQQSSSSTKSTTDAVFMGWVLYLWFTSDAHLEDAIK
jgi:hypothetical protein